MREILFRAKGIEVNDKDKWYEGSYLTMNKTTYCFKEDYDSDPGNTEHFIVFDQMTDWGLPNRHMKADINPDTLCQFTGLYDKNCRRIFEGDIVRVPELTTNTIGIIRFGRYRTGDQPEPYHLGFWVDFANDDLLRNDIGFWADCRYMEVVGNIFDNPELMEV